MEIKIGKTELSDEAKEVLAPQYVYMKDANGAKVKFEVVNVVTWEKRVFLSVKNPAAKEGKAKLAMFEFVSDPTVEGGGRYVIVTDPIVLATVVDKANKNLKKMDEMGIIPEMPKN